MSETRIDVVRRCAAEERPLQVGVEWLRELAAEIDALIRPANVAAAVNADDPVTLLNCAKWVVQLHDDENFTWDAFDTAINTLREAIAEEEAAPAVPVVELDEWAIVDKNNVPARFRDNTDEASISRQDLDTLNPQFAPHRVMRVCLKEVDRG